MPGIEVNREGNSRATPADWIGGTGGRASGAGGAAGAPPVFPFEGLPQDFIWKDDRGHITAIDLNTGERLWRIPNGDAPTTALDATWSHPLLHGLAIEANRGRNGHVSMMATGSLLLVTDNTSDDAPHLFAIDKLTGRRVGQLTIPAGSHYGISSIVHEGQQYILVQQPAVLMALTLP